ncbi:hypothetical protein BDF19DRAFT_453936 [Syncephalis fuscata]|nr:hypothetical protein BDF19DRAFT_453936 [Syncephalis fuscata]
MSHDHTGNAKVNVDLIVHVLKTSVFHYAFGFVGIIAVKAFELSWQHPLTLFFLYYTAFLLAVYGIAYVLRPKGRIDWKDQVVVITGGASGLGNCLAEGLALRGADVAILDINETKSHMNNIRSYKCDLRDPDMIKTVANRIREEIGTPTILINNAGVVYPGPILEIEPDKIRQTFEVNIISHFWTVREFLPDMLEADRGHIVTVASLLGCIGSGGLTAYSSSKSGAIIFHDALQHELYMMNTKVRTTLVCPGHLSTAMFNMLLPANTFLLPTLSPIDLSIGMIETIEKGANIDLYMPWGSNLGHLFAMLPASAKCFIRKIAGSSYSVSQLVRSKN